MVGGGILRWKSRQKQASRCPTVRNHPMMRAHRTWRLRTVLFRSTVRAHGPAQDLGRNRKILPVVRNIYPVRNHKRCPAQPVLHVHLRTFLNEVLDDRWLIADPGPLSSGPTADALL